MMKKILTLTFLVFCTIAKAESVPFNGIVTDITGQPIKGVKIWVSNEKRYATSDKKGRFGLTDVQSDDTLHLKYKKEYYAIAVAGKKSARIRLANELLAMEEDQDLVDIGYGYVKRRECSISTSGISGEELARTGETNIIAALQGRIPGLNISTSGRPGGDQTVQIRGIHSLYGSNEPLYVLDDTIVSDFDGVNIYDVDYVEVLRDAAIYGSRGANGAIIVHTKTAR